MGNEGGNVQVFGSEWNVSLPLTMAEHCPAGRPQTQGGV